LQGDVPEKLFVPVSMIRESIDSTPDCLQFVSVSLHSCKYYLQ